MNSPWMVLLMALLPGAGNFAGAMTAEFWRSSPRLLNWSLHAASGIVIAIVAVELFPEAVGTLAGWWLAAAFAAGGGAYLLLEAGQQRLRCRHGTGDSRGGMWMIYIAVAVDLTSDGLMLGSGAALSPALGFVLAAGQVLADLPEGYAVMANFRDKQLPRRRRLMLSASFFFYALASAAIAYTLLRNAPETWKLAALIFAAGLLTVAAVEDMLEEAHEARLDSRRSILAFIAGFALFTLVSAGLDSLLTA